MHCGQESWRRIGKQAILTVADVTKGQCQENRRVVKVFQCIVVERHYFLIRISELQGPSKFVAH